MLGCIHKPMNEGEIRYKITYAGNIDEASVKLMPQSMVLNFKNNKLRLKLSGGLGELKPIAVIDGPKGEIALLNKFTGEIDSRKLLKKDTSLRSTGISDKISGHQCIIFNAANRNATYTVWATKDIPLFINGTSRLEGFYLANYSGIPLKIVDKEQDFTINFIADSISLTVQPDSLFTPKSQ